MKISLTPEQVSRLQAYVARGEYATTEEAARGLLDERLAEREAESDDDLAWAKTCVDEALADVAAGEILSHEEHGLRNAARLAALKGL